MQPYIGQFNKAPCLITSPPERLVFDENQPIAPSNTYIREEAVYRLKDELHDNYEVNKPLTGLQRLLDEAPYLARCSYDKTATKVRPREFAIRYPYITVNSKVMTSWLVFDIDHEDLEYPDPYIWEKVGLPAPSLIVRDRHTNKCHLFYAIVPVCTSDNAHLKPIQYMKAIYQAMAKKLKADECYSGPVSKTPFHPWWSTTELHREVYSLGELADYVVLESNTPWGVKEANENSHSRHCLLFDKLRFFAYSIVKKEREEGSFDSFQRRLTELAHRSNHFTHVGFDSNLPSSSLRSTVKSVADWTWANYYGRSDCHRHVMQLDDRLPLEEKQALAAKRTHQQRSEKTVKQITIAYHRLVQAKMSITQVAIAAAARVSRQTVAKYQTLLAELSESVISIIPLESLFRQKQDVNYAVHQITALYGGVSLEGSIDNEDLPFTGVVINYQGFKP
ncbi:hypothetical protein BCT54_19570 [Vibrio splendidus]|uniref:Primase C-terminal 1 domain-containing protein n=2 Tax=Vibrionaceae TaxID=641 RepID=A0A2N7JTW4_VIBSP|nr:hypothetical protein BCT54_19570 [Vibrio splendidus]